MGNLASTQLSTQSDPALVQRQILADREKQLASITNPQQQLAARLGGLLGGGLVNVAQDRGFFDINDPLLNRVTQIQGIYNEVASRVDPTADPARFYSELQSAYSNAGLGREALLASQEGQKAQREGLSLEATRLDLFSKNPELLDKEIAKATDAEDLEKVAQLEGLKKRVTEMRQLEVDKTKAQINQANAQAAVAKASAEGKDIVYVPDITGAKIPYERKGNTLVPLKIEGQSLTTTPAGSGQGKFNQGKKAVYNPQTGLVEYK